MVDQFIGLLLLGLGINKGIYAPNSNVKGDTTVATPAAVHKEINTFRLNPKNFEKKQASTAGVRKFDTHAFGVGVLHMQEDFAKRMEASREAARREFEDHKKELRQKLLTIKDTRKQAIVEKVNTNCQDINTKRTDKMTEMLGKLSTILTNVSNRSASASASGKDTTSVDTAVTTAQTAIADAQEAVSTQAGKTCTITLTTETSLKTDVGKVIHEMEQNLKSVYDKVVAARKAVGDAIRALAVVTGEHI